MKRKIKIPRKDVIFLKENYPKMSRIDIAEHLGWSINHLVYVAKTYGLHQSKEYRSKAARDRMMTPLTEEQERYLIENYADTKNEVFVKAFGLCKTTISQLAKERGLKKSDEFMVECRDENLRMARTTNIINGWPPKGYRVPGGGFKKGVTNIMRLGAEKEAERRKKAAEGRRRLIKMEKARILYGLPQKTTMKLVAQPRRKIDQRWYLKSRGYIVDDEERVAYYDEKTKRSKRIEELEEFFAFADIKEREEYEEDNVQ